MPGDFSEDYYEPFGEALAQPKGQIAASGSRTLRYLGVGVFWTLVATIVTARVLLFDPDFNRTFGTVKTFWASLVVLFS